jgi:hypothetical protein
MFLQWMSLHCASANGVSFGCAMDNQRERLFVPKNPENDVGWHLQHEYH